MSVENVSELERGLIAADLYGVEVSRLGLRGKYDSSPQGADKHRRSYDPGSGVMSSGSIFSVQGCHVGVVDVGPEELAVWSKNLAAHPERLLIIVNSTTMDEISFHKLGATRAGESWEIWKYSPEMGRYSVLRYNPSELAPHASAVVTPAGVFVRKNGYGPFWSNWFAKSLTEEGRNVKFTELSSDALAGLV